MPRRNYDARKGRPRPQTPGGSARWQELLGEIARAGGASAAGRWEEGRDLRSLSRLSIAFSTHPRRLW